MDLHRTAATVVRVAAVQTTTATHAQQELEPQAKATMVQLHQAIAVAVAVVQAQQDQAKTAATVQRHQFRVHQLLMRAVAAVHQTGQGAPAAVGPEQLLQADQEQLIEVAAAEAAGTHPAAQAAQEAQASSLFAT